MTYLYFIYSPSKNKIYVGVTDDPKERLQKHNDHSYQGAYTKIANDWEFVFHKEYQNRQNALFLEQFIKKMKSRKFIEKIMDNPDILEDILKKQK
ncbi:GIY-YIG nuclease family protein [Flavobacteriaceae bacterium M23B6Z8]